MNRSIICFILFITSSLAGFGQEEDIFNSAKKEAENDLKNKTVYTIATFKNSRLINGHSIETVGRGLMDFRIHHRFGYLNQGVNDLFGLDNAITYIGFDFGLTDRLMIGFSRSSYLKQLETFAKYKLLRQSTGKISMPISVTLMTAATLRTGKQTDSVYKKTVSDRMAYTAQLIIARKFSENFSLQVMPTFVHFNMVPGLDDPNNLFSIGMGVRQKVSHRVSVNAEYYYQTNNFSGYTNSLALGVDIETGGHVFQLHLTNSTGMTAPSFIHQTTGKWDNGDIHFGFNVSRIFNIKKKNS
ncbi:DUF5777 family beta-barrel protein [Ferruginibacter lapsinanis]|uniref:DUF5777 family beta-barrel protein n=1 Tax=Ferruginibacter lapsinanis TaxID=563172 RepID=UPI001E29C957|nr:DUF5777 family beta-barrel protein [Ferruginibacter lapsinanis]UEG51291.1 DUF5777 family beta-barrel protein [Ferruginibacter lapsinanis]